MLKTVNMSLNNRADLGTNTLATGTLSLLRGLNDWWARMRWIKFPVQHNFFWRISKTHTATPLQMLEKALDEIVSNDQRKSLSNTGFEKPWTRSGATTVCCVSDFAPTVAQILMKPGLLAGGESLRMPAHLPSLFGESQSGDTGLVGSTCMQTACVGCMCSLNTPQMMTKHDMVW